MFHFPSWSEQRFAFNNDLFQIQADSWNAAGQTEFQAKKGTCMSLYIHS